jgi:hypothetical protein
MITKHVYLNFVKENSMKKSELARSESIYFFNAGPIEFKGVSLPSYEVIFENGEKYKAKFVEALEKLYGSIRESLWEQRVFVDMMEVINAVCRAMPPFEISGLNVVGNSLSLNNDGITRLCSQALKAYLREEDYAAAVAKLREIIANLEQVPGFDRLVLDYARGVADKYGVILNEFEEAIDKEVNQKIDLIFHEKHKRAYFAAKKNAEMYENLRLYARKSNALNRKKVLWYDLIKQKQDEMRFTLYSGKS